jgi:hypothetical protein
MQQTHPGVFRVLLQHLLQVVVLLADGVREPGGALAHKKFTLGQCIVVTAEYPGLDEKCVKFLIMPFFNIF